MKSVKTVEIVLENCEEIRLPIYVFGEFSFESFKESISRIANNAICKTVTANEIAIEIFSEANNFKEASILWDKCNIIERLYKYNDITQFNFIYEDGTEECILVDYYSSTDALGAPNINQTSFLSDLGNLYIVISKNKTVHEVFGKEINDSDLLNFKKRMYGTIGE